MITRDNTPGALTLLLTPYANFCPVASQHRQCSSSSSPSPPVLGPSPTALGLDHAGCGVRLQLALGMAFSPTFQISTRLDVAPAMKAPSGVKASATMGDSIVRKALGLFSGMRAFQTRIEQSSLPDAMSRSSSAGFACRGCHASAVMADECAAIDRRWPVSSQSCRQKR